ncbi:MAG: glycerate kinase [Pseudomonadota bacterium]
MSLAAPSSERVFLRGLFDQAVHAVLPIHCVPKYLPAPPVGRTIVIGAGKAAGAMAAALETHWLGELSGLVVTRYGHRVPTARIEVIEAAHPVPDAASQTAAKRMLALVRGLTADDLVICLMSGGASSLLSLPAEGLTLADKQAVNRALLRCGATIAEMNCVRKHLSAIKGGRLAQACYPARIETLVLSDIPGDDPALVGSGPTFPDASTCADAMAVVARYGLQLDAHILAALSRPGAETPKADEACFINHHPQLIASAQHALESAAFHARAQGWTVHIVSDAIEGEARDVALMHAAMVRHVRSSSESFAPPCLILSGGETTVTLRGNGRGGRNSEFLLALAIALDGMPGVHAIACDTDGIDGSEDNAGAFIDPTTLARAQGAGLDPRVMLAENDAVGFFEPLGDLLVTGPTLTNVNDFRAIAIY